MDDRTLEALKASIAKWERNAEETNIDEVRIGVSACPLCALYWKIEREDSCRGCPVFETGAFRCGGTPYDDAEIAYSNWCECDDESDDALTSFRVHAKAEVDFLKSLLPEGK